MLTMISHLPSHFILKSDESTSRIGSPPQQVIDLFYFRSSDEQSPALMIVIGTLLDGELLVVSRCGSHRSLQAEHPLALALQTTPQPPDLRLRITHCDGALDLCLPNFAKRLADRCGIAVVLPAYRLAPENPFPAGFNDAWKALVALRGRIGDAPLLVGGDSAGGGLAAALGVYAASQGAPRIDAALLYSPWVDMTITAASFKDNAETDLLFPEASAQTASDTYMQDFDLKHPIASPLFADLAAFPSAFINVGDIETLRDDSVSLHEKLLAAGVRSELLVVAGMEHVAPVRGADLVGSAESFEATVTFVDSLLG